MGDWDMNKRLYIFTIVITLLIPCRVSAGLRDDLDIIEAKFGVDNSNLKTFERISYLENELGLAQNDRSVIERVSAIKTVMGIDIESSSENEDNKIESEMSLDAENEDSDDDSDSYIEKGSSSDIENGSWDVEVESINEESEGDYEEIEELANNEKTVAEAVEEPHKYIEGRSKKNKMTEYDPIAERAFLYEESASPENGFYIRKNGSLYSIGRRDQSGSSYIYEVQQWKGIYNKYGPRYCGEVICLDPDYAEPPVYDDNSELIAYSSSNIPTIELYRVNPIGYTIAAHRHSVGSLYEFSIYNEERNLVKDLRTNDYEIMIENENGKPKESNNDRRFARRCAAAAKHG